MPSYATCTSEEIILGQMRRPLIFWLIAIVITLSQIDMIKLFLYNVKLALHDLHVNIFWQELMHPFVYLAMHLTVLKIFFLIAMVLQKFEKIVTKMYV